MGLPDSSLISWVFQLLPGFIAAWIFYGFTAHPQKTPFERTVQALIFTAFTKAIVIPLGWVLLVIGHMGTILGPWNENTAFVVSVLVAILLGIVFSGFANSSKLHDVLPDWITKQTSFPSEWYSAFKRDSRYIYLHLTGGRRLWGWPTEWPDNPDKGHFVIQEPEWILDDNQRAPLLLTYKMVIPVSDVLMVEFEKWPGERDYSPGRFEKSQRLLLNAQQESQKETES